MKSIFEMMKSVERVGERTCEQCGSTVPIYKNNGEEVSICMTCENNQLQKKTMQFYEERKNRAIERLIKKYEIPPYNEPITFDDYQPQTASQKEAKNIAMSFADMKETTLFLQGKPGVGKTHLSWCLADGWHKTSLFVDMPGLLGTLRSSFNRGSTFSEEEFFRLVDDVDLLVLDDIGAEYAKNENGMESWVADILYRIVNAREGKRNIYTTNYRGKELQQKYGNLSGRIISRMMSNAKIVKIDGQDYRLKGLD